MKIELVIRIALGKKFSKFINLISHSQKTIFTKTVFKIFSESVVDRESTPFSNSKNVKFFFAHFFVVPRKVL